MVDCRTLNLPSTVPQIQHQIAHEAYIAVLDIDGGSKSADVFGDIVTEDNGAHRRLSRTRLSHQQYFALLRAFERSSTHDGGIWK